MDSDEEDLNTCSKGGMGRGPQGPSTPRSLSSTSEQEFRGDILQEHHANMGDDDTLEEPNGKETGKREERDLGEAGRRDPRVLLPPTAAARSPGREPEAG